MRRVCVTCGREQILGREIDGNIIILDPEPVDATLSDLALTVLGDLDDQPTVLWGIATEGDRFWNIPAGAPRYRKHDCAAAH